MIVVRPSIIETDTSHVSEPNPLIAKLGALFIVYTSNVAENNSNKCVTNS